MRLLNGNISDPGTGQGPYGGNDPTLQRTSLQIAWNGFVSSNTDAFCITNGQFFSPNPDPTPLAFPLKKNGVILSDGYDSDNPIYGQKLLMLEIWGNRADIRALTKNALYSSSAPNILGGLSEDYPKGATNTGRTFAGIDDTDGNGTYDKIFIFNSKSASQTNAARVLRDFGADKVIMVDGGGSTQLNCRGTTYVSSTRTIPQTIGIVASGFNSQFANNAPRWTPLNGNWSVLTAGYYHSVGIPNTFTSTMHSNNYSTITYTVKMRETGCANCGIYIYFRGSPFPISAENRWNDAYVLEYVNSGYYWIGMAQNGQAVTFVDWTYSPVITSSWNILKVTANGNFIQFFINGTRVAYGNLSNFSTGQVGIGFWRDTSPGNHLYVDWATLNKTAPSAIVAEEGILINELDARVDPGAMEGPRFTP